MLVVTSVALVMALAYGPSVVSSDCQRIVCYYTNWAQYRPSPYKFFPEDTPPHMCTHIMYAFAQITNNKLAPYEHNDDSTSWSKGMYERLSTHVRGLDPNVKILLSVGGWNIGTKCFTDVVSSHANITQFASTAVHFLRKHKFHGLDIDWEYPANRGSPPEDKKRYILLLQALKRAFRDENAIEGPLMLTAAMAAGKSTIDTAYDVKKVAKLLDFMTLMAYDLHGSWETFTGLNSPLYSRDGEQGEQKQLNVDYAARYWVEKGMPKDKIVIGLATYGRTFTLESASNSGLAAPAKGAGSAGKYSRTKGFLAYYEICALLRKESTKAFFDKEHRVPYLVNGDQWVGYEDKQSLREKVKYVKANGYSGVMIWTLDLDDSEGGLCKEKFPLINAIVKECNAKGHNNGSAFVIQPDNQDLSVAVPVCAPEPDLIAVPAVDPSGEGLQSEPVAITDDYPGGQSEPVAIPDGYSGGQSEPVAIPDGYSGGQSEPVAIPDGYSGGQSEPVAIPDGYSGGQSEPVAIPDDYPDTTTIPEPLHLSPNDFCKGKEHILFRDPTDCTHFYNCGFTNVLVSCPGGLLFNEEGQYCDWPSQVSGCP